MYLGVPQGTSNSFQKQAKQMMRPQRIELPLHPPQSIIALHLPKKPLHTPTSLHRNHIQTGISFQRRQNRPPLLRPDRGSRKVQNQGGIGLRLVDGEQGMLVLALAQLGVPHVEVARRLQHF